MNQPSGNRLRPMDEGAIVRRIADRACQRICRRLIRSFVQIRSTLFGDDSPLQNVWEDICVQEQQADRSIIWEDTYEASLMAYLEGSVEELDEATRWAIWQQTQAGIDWRADEGEPPKGCDSRSIGEHILREYVLQTAESYSNSRIRTFIDRYYSD